MSRSGALRGRLAREDCFPSHAPDLEERYLVLRGGERVRVVLGGKPGAEPVVFVHGWGCSSYFFRHLYGPVVGTGRRVVAVELRGHGWSGRPLDGRLYSTGEMKAFLAQVLDALALGPAHFVSHSLGGAVTIDLLSAQGGRARSLSLLAPVGLAPLRWIGLMRFLTPSFVAPLIPYGVPRWSVPLVMRAVYGSRGRWAGEDVDEYWAPTADPDYARALRLALHHYSFASRSDEEILGIGCPVLVMLGGKDLLVNTPRAYDRARALGVKRLVVVPRAGHVLAEEVPEVVIEEVLGHIADAS